MTDTTPTTDTDAMLLPGWGVSIILRQPVNDLVCYVGEVQAVDERGIRITGMDWFVGECVGMDWWFPWSDIAAMEIATDAHSGWDPGRTQKRAIEAYEKQQAAADTPL